METTEIVDFVPYEWRIHQSRCENDENQTLREELAMAAENEEEVLSRAPLPKSSPEKAIVEVPKLVIPPKVDKEAEAAGRPKSFAALDKVIAHVDARDQ